MNPIPYARQFVSEDDIERVRRALEAPFITQGPLVAAFERALADAVGARFAAVFNSGTAALHAAYFAAGVRPGVSVLTSPITFVATANASLYLGGGVHFADVDPTTALIDPDYVERATSSGIGVLTPVHFAGHTADMERLAALARERSWTIVEDAAHALGASYRTSDGRECTVGSCSHSAMCCFSFHAVKHITTGEGGAVTTNDESLHKALLRFRTHGITREENELERHDGPWYYEQHDLGFNYRMTDFQCALGLSQLARLNESVDRRRTIAARYDAAFADVPLVQPLTVPAWSTGAYHLYVVRVPAPIRRHVFGALRQVGIGVNVHYIPVPRQPYYQRLGFDSTSLRGAETYYSEALTLPMFPQMSDADVDAIVAETARAVAATAGQPVMP